MINETHDDKELQHMKVLVVGAQLGNKGAESMLYIVTDEMKKRLPDAEVYFATSFDYDASQYTFKSFPLSHHGLEYAVNGHKVLPLLKGICKDIVKKCTHKNPIIGHYLDVEKRFSAMDMMIDVSGFNLGKQWSMQTHRNFLNRIALAKRHNIPVYLMPQSFGPFDYDADMEGIKRLMESLLPYPKLIFAREKEGYDELIHTFHLHNVVLSTDLVLQNTGIDWRNVFTSEPAIDVPKVADGSDSLEKHGIVGIVPNKQCFSHGNKDWNLKIYQAVIDQLLKDGYQVIIFRHSREDLEIAKMIKELYKNNSDVYLEKKEFSCLEYDEYVKQFSFIICSRYHGIVHAYRNFIPAIALGWAIKYQALADCVGQGQYAFDITEGLCSIEEIVGTVREMENKSLENREMIREHVTEIQKNSCFDQMEMGMQ